MRRQFSPPSLQLANQRVDRLSIKIFQPGICVEVAIGAFSLTEWNVYVEASGHYALLCLKTRVFDAFPRAAVGVFKTTAGELLPVFQPKTMTAHSDDIAEIFIKFRNPLAQTAHQGINGLFANTFAASFWPNRVHNAFSGHDAAA